MQNTNFRAFIVANTVPGVHPLAPAPPKMSTSHDFFFTFFRAFFLSSTFKPQGPERPPKGIPEIVKTRENLQKVSRQFKPRTQPCKKGVQSVKIILPSTFWLDFQGSRAFQKACKMVSEMVSKTNKTMQSGYLKKCQNAHIQNNLTIIETIAPGVKIRALKKLVWSPARHRGIAHINAEFLLTLLGPQGLPRASKTRAMASKRCSKDVTKPSQRRPQK